MEHAEIREAFGDGHKQVKQYDPLHCILTNTRVRFWKQHSDGMVEVTDNNGKVLPDFRHPSQLRAY